MAGHIRLDRKILEWEWWEDINTYRLFTYMLLAANWKDGNFKGVDVPRGSFVSSMARLSEKTNLTVDEVRTALKHLKKTKEITSKSHSKFSVFTVNNYNLYQGDPEQVPSKSQADPEQFPTIKEIKERKKGKQDNKKDMCKADANALFEELWKRYPVKKGKGQVSLAAKQRLLKVGHDEMIRTIDRYLAELEKDSDWRKPQNGSTFFNSGYIDYLDDNFVPGQVRQKQKKNQFNSFPQRQRNSKEMSDLEKKLLGR